MWLLCHIATCWEIHQTVARLITRPWQCLRSRVHRPTTLRPPNIADGQNIQHHRCLSSGAVQHRSDPQHTTQKLKRVGRGD
ncbi:hypothetical protein Micbo1qcDRAFT_162202 [Microdochium bolleyi]|uniref:Secreted protein n=1 Tax=Microdochium bolleyi TaxID=196109 RepID=A0A136J4G1_9PEZI|nr:hypothetical protein Micbo1qcDRAFT_162202 [Microdochium bolleyi]